MFLTLRKYSSSDTLSQLPMNIHRNYERNLTRVSHVLRGIKRAICRKLVKISDCRLSSFLKALPGCRVSRHNSIFWVLLTQLFLRCSVVLNAPFHCFEQVIIKCSVEWNNRSLLRSLRWSSRSLFRK